MSQHVGLIDPGEAFDRRTVETHALGEGTFELGRRDSNRFQETKNIGKPHADKPHIALFNRPQNELGLLIHAAQSAAQDATASSAGRLLLAHRALGARCRSRRCPLGCRRRRSRKRLAHLLLRRRVRRSVSFRARQS
jgi:hypothetical protein